MIMMGVGRGSGSVFIRGWNFGRVVWEGGKGNMVNLEVEMKAKDMGGAKLFNVMDTRQ